MLLKIKKSTAIFTADMIEIQIKKHVINNCVSKS